MLLAIEGGLYSKELIFKSSMKGLMYKETTQSNFMLDKIGIGRVTLNYTVSNLSSFIAVLQGGIRHTSIIVELTSSKDALSSTMLS
jgi:hypothetical protein